MRAISLYSGIGGIDLAMVHAGFTIVAQVEIDPFCREVLAYHAPKYWRYSTVFSDVRTFGRTSIDGRIDLIAGGFPCQPFSIAGSRKGKDDNRNLWGEFARIIGEFRPRAVLLENVPAICNAHKIRRPSSTHHHPNRFTRIWKRRVVKEAYALTVVKDLAEMGYVCRWGIVSAEDAGAMHERKRWFCVAYLADPNEFRLGNEQRYTQQRPHTYDSQWDTAPEKHRRNNKQSRVKSPSQISNAHRQRQPQLQRRVSYEWRWIGNCRKAIRNTTGKGLEGRSRRKSANSMPAKSSRANSRRVSKSRLGNTPDGIPVWLVAHRRVAGPDQAQFWWEHPRTVPKKVTKHDAKIKALGNAVFVPTVFALCIGIRQMLKQMELL